MRVPPTAKPAIAPMLSPLGLGRAATRGIVSEDEGVAVGRERVGVRDTMAARCRK